jgi:hypothetical protein
MKKIENSRLTLSRETLRKLTHREMRAVGGGRIAEPETVVCGGTTTDTGGAAYSNTCMTLSCTLGYLCNPIP